MTRKETSAEKEGSFCTYTESIYCNSFKNDVISSERSVVEKSLDFATLKTLSAFGISPLKGENMTRKGTSAEKEGSFCT